MKYLINKMRFKSALYRTLNWIKFKKNDVKVGRDIDVKYHFFLRKHPNSSITIGKGFSFFNGFYLNPLNVNQIGGIATEQGSVITIGDNVGISSSLIWSHNSITIGNRVTIGAGCLIMDSDAHSLNYLDRGTPKDMINKESRPIVIEEDVFIGARSILLKGVTIGARSIIGAGSVVTKSIPADCKAAGNPARVIKEHIN